MSLPLEKVDIEKHLQRFGLSAFRPGQDKVIQSVFDGHDSLCIMPTGGGKSLCYQFPSVARQGTTLVVSPLIALMKDQVDSLVARGINAAYINSSQTQDEQSKSIQGLKNGQLDLLYVAPERLRSPRFIDAIQATQVQLLAIDEAHCISQWGHDFRPDYARLGQLRERIGDPQTIALTATATRDVQEDIILQLGLENPATFVTGFSRENLSLQVGHPSTLSDKNDQLIRFLDKHPGSGIIYASTRKKCEEICTILSGQKRKFGFYHGGLDPDSRDQIQNEFMQGQIDVIVATNAFGMGIDKADIRFVIHYNIPGTLEAYYQEAGRAGRDGQPSDCMLLYSNGDRFIQEFFIENAYPSRKMVEQVYEYLRSLDDDPIEMTLQEIKDALSLDIASDGIAVCEQLLEKAGAIERMEAAQNQASVKLTGQLDSFVELLPRDARTRRKVLKRIEKLVGSVRDERVYFHPRQLADDKLSVESVTRAIRQLNEAAFFDYVPPFRGRAVHVTDRTRKFGTWEIDFEAMNQRKALEYQKLQTVVDFANSKRCRQLEILDYFGDRDQKLCHTCDNCRGGSSTSQTSDIPMKYLAGVFHAVRIVLSGVARSRGRFGRSMVSQMLWGSSSAKVRKAGMDKLSTFGMLSFLTQSEIETVIDSLIAANLVKQSEKTRFRPTIEIAEWGKGVMRGDMPLPPQFSLEESLSRKMAFQFPDADVPLTDSQQGPTTSQEIGEPDQIEEPREIEEPVDSHERGHESKNQEPTEYLQSTDLPENHVEPGVQADKSTKESHQRPEFAVEAESLPSRSERPDWTWTIELIEYGYSTTDVLAIRRMEMQDLFDHLFEAVESEALTDPEFVFNKRECEYLADASRNEGSDAPIKMEWVPPEFLLNAVHLYEKIRRIA